MQNRLFDFLKRHRLLSFFIMTYGISWGIPGFALLLSALTGAFEVSLEEYSPLSPLPSPTWRFGLLPFQLSQSSR